MTMCDIVYRRGTVILPLRPSQRPPFPCTSARESRVSLLYSESFSLSRSYWTRLVAPYCAIPRDYLSDTPLLPAMGFLVSQHGQLGAISPLFSERFPLGEHAKWRCDTPLPQKGYLSDTGAIPNENKANGCDTPLCDTISKGYCAIGGASRTGPLSGRVHTGIARAV